MRMCIYCVNSVHTPDRPAGQSIRAGCPTRFEHCNILISVGECAIMGGLPAMRNGIPIKECLEEAYLNGPTVKNNTERIIPNDPELPILLDKVYPCHEVVKMDFHLPGCPPRADLIWEALVALITGNEMKLPYEVVKFD